MVEGAHDLKRGLTTVWARGFVYDKVARMTFVPLLLFRDVVEALILLN